MLKKEDFAVIKALAQRGIYLKDIAAELGVHPKTVRRALQRGSAPTPHPPPRGSKLDPFKPQVDQLLSEGVWNAVVILRELQAAGYTGSHSILRDYIAPKRALRASRATVRFETPPGRQLQSDWGELTTLVAGVATKVYFIVNELAYSRRFHFWAAPHNDAEHTYEGLIRSFEYFGGVPAEVLVDNQKAAVLLHQGDGLQFNPRFLDLGTHYGFRPRACRPYRARTKGKDERMVGYVKHHFFVRYRSFESWAHLNQLALQWLREEADLREHGTLHEVVAGRLPAKPPAYSRCRRRVMTRPTWNTAASVGTAILKSAPTAIASRPGWRASRCACASASTARCASLPGRCSSPRTSSSPRPPAGSRSPSITPRCGRPSVARWKCVPSAPTRRPRNGTE